MAIPRKKARKPWLTEPIPWDVIDEQWRLDEEKRKKPLSPDRGKRKRTISEGVA